MHRFTARAPRRVALIAGLALVLLLLVVSAASAQQAATLTLGVRVTPSTDPGRFDLAIDGVTLAAAVGDGGTTGAQTVLPGTFAISQLAATGTSAAGYTTTVTCVDGADTVIDAAPLTTTAVVVPAGHGVACTFSNTPVAAIPSTPIAAPPIGPHPILLPPAMVRGTAILRGPEGCVPAGVVATRVIARNIIRLVFVRDGHVVKRVVTPSTVLRIYVLGTVVHPDDVTAHVVRVRADFLSGAVPRQQTLVQRFAQCRADAVAG
jgi:hypothetical protein